MIKHEQNTHVFLVLALSLASILFTSTLIEVSKSLKARAPGSDIARMSPRDPNSNGPEERNYSYSIEDFPERLSVPLAKVAMAVEESVHYDIESQASSYEWNKHNPGGKASIRVGTDYHAAGLAMSHQLHCVENFRNELKDGSSQLYGWGHLEHCANFMRQWAMCRADLTLEPGDFMHRDFNWDRKGAIYECLDWQTIYKELALNWQTWVSMWKEHHLGRYNLKPVSHIHKLFALNK